MYMLGHYDESIDANPVTAADGFEGFDENLLRGFGVKELVSLITTEGDEVSLAGLVVTLESPRHVKSVSRGSVVFNGKVKIPTQANNGLEWGTQR